MTSLILGAYWGPRAETAEASAARLSSVLSALGEIDAAFGRWFKKASRKQSAQAEIELAPGALQTLLETGVNRRDADGEPMSELGYSLGLWNGSTVSLGLVLGATRPETTAANHLVFRLPDPRDQPGLGTETTARQLVQVLVDTLDPAAVTITNVAWQPGTPLGDRAVGWITYLKDTESSSAEVSSDRVGSGILIQTAVTPDAVRPDDLARINATLVPAQTR